MSIRKREYLTVILIFVLALVSFGAGYLVNDVVRLRVGQAYTADYENDFPLFWEAWKWIERSYIGELPTSRQMTYGAVRGAIGSLNDPYTIFVEPAAREQERESLRGNFGGVGATLQRDADDNVVLSPIAGNPAEAAGILEGDILLAVDGQPVTSEMSVGDIAQLIRGEEGSEVVLIVRHPGDPAPVEVTIVRAIILLPSVSYRLLADDPSIGYIQLSRFSAESGGEVRDAIVSLREDGAQKLILDLRHNGGGLLEAAVDVSNHFLDEGPILYQVSKSEDEKSFEATGESIAADMPLIVLVNGATASSAEIVAGALQDQGRATLVGMPTFGKGSVQLVYDLSDGSSVHVTSARWYTPNRHQIDQLGLQPDIVVEPSDEAVADGRDEILEQAIANLQD